jgi:hypothetical protein
MPRRAAPLAAALTASSALLLSGCGDDAALDQAPGLAPPSCDMAFTPYRISVVTLPEEAPYGGLDLDQNPDDEADGGRDNAFGSLHATVSGLSQSWNVNPAIADHLLDQRLHWILEVGRCTDGGDEVRVALSRATDVDGDTIPERGPRAVAAVGTRAPRLVTSFGIADVPVGFLTDGGGADATDSWQRGFAFATDLTAAGDRLVGTIGFAVGNLTDSSVAPLAAYATRTLDEFGGIGDVWRAEDVDRDGVISPDEVRHLVGLLIRPDLDLGGCEADSCYRPSGDGERDRYSVGLTITAAPTELE